MTAASKNSLLLYARLCRLHNLVFFLLIMLFSCRSKEDTDIKVLWKNNKAGAVYLPRNLLKNIPDDSLRKHIKISLLGDGDATAILGDLQLKSSVIFKPVLPFSPRLVYELFYKNKKMSQFSIPAAAVTNFPKLITCYPQQDILPENLLKLYLAFSHPMSEGQSEKYITIIKNGRDTLKNVLLNLQPELWNEDRTVITLWLDPGRIKRGLQPNLRLGAPLKESVRYQLIISHNWKDAQGVPLHQDFTKFFTTGSRDSISPNTDHWRLISPSKDSREALTAVSDEVLDHYLFEECLYVKDDQGRIVKGTFEMDSGDKSCRFIPEYAWMSGNYSLMIEARLEDLAGNNLDRPFDRDILYTKQHVSKGTYIIMFAIN